MIQEHLIPPGGNWSSIIKNGKTLKIIDIVGGQGVDFLCYKLITQKNDIMHQIRLKLHLH